MNKLLKHFLWLLLLCFLIIFEQSANLFTFLPSLTIFCFAFFLKNKKAAFAFGFLGGFILDFYISLPLFALAVLFLLLAFLIRKLKLLFEEKSVVSFIISLLLWLFVSQTAIFFLNKIQ